MKKTYIVAIFVIIIAILFLMCLVLWPPKVDESPFGRLVKNAAILVPSLAALLAAFIALSVADPKKNKVKIEIEEPYLEEKGEYNNKESYRVHFNMKNISKFDFKKPLFTFTIPRKIRILTWNLISSGERPNTLQYKDEQIISNYGPPYWNQETSLVVWVRMVFDKNMDVFEVGVSVNCDNADGFTRPVEIKLKELIDNLNKEAK